MVVGQDECPHVDEFHNLKNSRTDTVDFYAPDLQHSALHDVQAELTSELLLNAQVRTCPIMARAGSDSSLRGRSLGVRLSESDARGLRR